MKKITLYPYQENALKKLGTSGEQVLSICPGGGKTFTAIEYINRNPQFKSVLILTHGTNVLKSQWIDELNKLDIPHSVQINSKEKITVLLPHSVIKKDIVKYDLIIVDEAHEFFFASMVQTIIQKSNPSCVLLLTGTPSKFIKDGFKPVIVSGVEVYQAGKLTDTYFGVVKSSYKLKLDDFNNDGETTGNLTTQQTLKSLESLVKEMLIRLKTAEYLKESPNTLNSLKTIKLNKFQQVFGKLNKTMIATKNIEQAKALHTCLINNKVNAVISTEEDRDNEQVKLFQDNPQINVLVVVRKGILGFNMTDLVNVVDFTMSRNIDRIYQLYARVLRTHDKYDKKFFFRMCSALNPEVDSLYLQAAMCLNSHDFISKYNGKNLEQLEIITPIENKPKKAKVSRTTTDKNAPKPIKMNKIMIEEILNLELLSELTINSSSEHWKEFGYMKFGKVISKLTGKIFRQEIDWTSLQTAWDTGVEKGLI